MTNKPPDLYRMFHNEVLKLSSQTEGLDLDVWSLLPVVNIGRKQTVALIRKFVKQMQDDYPSGVTTKNGRFQIARMLADFHKTHEEMGTPHEDRVEAWKGMIGLSQQDH